ncbi:MAG: glycosyltransferase family 4 protein [Pseudomonadota bacterium]
MCVLVGAFYPIVGGGETHSRQLCSALVSRGFSLFVVTRRQTKELKPYEMIDEIPVYRVWPGGMKRWGKYLMMFPALWCMIRLRREYDVIYVSVFRALGILGVITAKLLGKKCVLRAGVSGEMTGNSLLEEYQEKKPVSYFFLTVFLPLRNAVLRRADRFISISQEVREDFLAAGIPEEKITHIPNGVDTDRYHPVTKKRQSLLRETLNLPDGQLFCYSGKLNQGKGLELVVRVWPEVIRQYPAARVIFIGGGANQFLSFESKLREEVGQRGLEEVILFTGYVSNVADYLQACDCFLFPSESEGMPNALLEAVSCGLPVVATRIGGNTDILNEDHLGYLIPVGDEKALLESVLALLQDSGKAEAMSRAMRLRIEGLFALDVMLGRYAELFTGIDVKRV